MCAHKRLGLELNYNAKLDKLIEVIGVNAKVTGEFASAGWPREILLRLGRTTRQESSPQCGLGRFAWETSLRFSDTRNPTYFIIHLGFDTTANGLSFIITLARSILSRTGSLTNAPMNPSFIPTLFRDVSTVFLRVQDSIYFVNGYVLVHAPHPT